MRFVVTVWTPSTSMTQQDQSDRYLRSVCHSVYCTQSNWGTSSYWNCQGGCRQAVLPLIRSNREVASSATLTRRVPRLFLTIHPLTVQIATHDMSLVDRVMNPREGICPNAAVHESAVVRTTRFPR